MKKTIITLTIAALLGLSACTGANESTEPVDVAVNDLPSDEADEAPEDTVDDTTVALGESFTWEDGLTVKVEQAGPFTPSPYSAGGEGFPVHQKYVVTIQNDTNGPIDPSGFYTTASADGAEGDEVFDEGLDGAPMTKILPGKSVTFNIGYGLMSEDVQIDVTPTFEHWAATFLSSGAGDDA